MRNHNCTHRFIHTIYSKRSNETNSEMSEWNAVKNIMRQGHRCMNFLHIFQISHTYSVHTLLFRSLSLFRRAVNVFVRGRAREQAQNHIAVLVTENVLIELIAILD